MNLHLPEACIAFNVRIHQTSTALDSLIPAGLVVACGLVAALLLLVLCTCVVALMAVLLKERDRRESGVKVLAELKQILTDLIEAVGRSGRTPPRQ